MGDGQTDEPAQTAGPSFGLMALVKSVLLVKQIRLGGLCRRIFEVPQGAFNLLYGEG